jgi:transcriptional regulator with XRE-family HTH domain
VRAESVLAFGRRVRELRIARRWPLERLARESSLTVSTISGIERGVQEPRLSTVTSLIYTLEVSPGALIGELPDNKTAKRDERVA